MQIDITIGILACTIHQLNIDIDNIFYKQVTYPQHAQVIHRIKGQWLVQNGNYHCK